MVFMKSILWLCVLTILSANGAPNIHNKVVKKETSQSDYKKENDASSSHVKEISQSDYRKEHDASSSHVKKISQSDYRKEHDASSAHIKKISLSDYRKEHDASSAHIKEISQSDYKKEHDASSSHVKKISQSDYRKEHDASSAHIKEISQSDYKKENDASSSQIKKISQSDYRKEHDASSSHVKKISQSDYRKDHDSSRSHVKEETSQSDIKKAHKASSISPDGKTSTYSKHHRASGSYLDDKSEYKSAKGDLVQKKETNKSQAGSSSASASSSSSTTVGSDATSFPGHPPHQTVDIKEHKPLKGPEEVITHTHSIQPSFTSIADTKKGQHPEPGKIIIHGGKTSTTSYSSNRSDLVSRHTRHFKNPAHFISIGPATESTPVGGPETIVIPGEDSSTTFTDPDAIDDANIPVIAPDPIVNPTVNPRDDTGPVLFPGVTRSDSTSTGPGPRHPIIPRPGRGSKAENDNISATPTEFKNPDRYIIEGSKPVEEPETVDIDEGCSSNIPINTDAIDVKDSTIVAPDPIVKPTVDPRDDTGPVLFPGVTKFKSSSTGNRPRYPAILPCQKPCINMACLCHNDLNYIAQYISRILKI